MNRSLIFLSAFSAFPRSTSRAVKLAAAHGFDGIEIFLDAHTKPELPFVLEEATRLGLKQTLHQFWSHEENPSAVNSLLCALGYTLPNGYSLREQLAGDQGLPSVIYADRAPEALLLSNECWWQTTSTVLPSGRYRMSYERFINLVRAYRRPVVFDTQHVLEYIRGQHGIAHIPQDRKVNLRDLMTAWRELRPCVSEIHFNDSSLSRGERGRNVFPGEGELPLQEFADLVKADGWRGNIVAEVSPMHLFPARHEIPRLRDRIHAFWDA